MKPGVDGSRVDRYGYGSWAWWRPGGDPRGDGSQGQVVAAGVGLPLLWLWEEEVCCAVARET